MPTIFKGTDGKTYGFPKDGNTIAMAYNTDLVTSPPATMDGAGDGGQAPQGHGQASRRRCASIPASTAASRSCTPRAARCSSADGNDRADRARDASKAAVQWYLDLFKNGLGMTASDLGDGWCGEALGKGEAAIDVRRRLARPYMTSDVSRTSSTPGPRCRPARPAAR